MHMSGFMRGFTYLLKGFKELFASRKLLVKAASPIILNTILFLGFVALGAYIVANWLVFVLPQAWWAALLLIAAVFVSILLFLFFGIILFATIANVIGAPFYESIADSIENGRGGITVSRGFLKDIVFSFRHAAVKLWFYVVAQAGLLVLYFVPLAFGTISYSALGFMVTVGFLSLEFLDFAFDRRGFSFKQRKKWMAKRSFVVAGFGTAIFFGYAIPIVNLFVSPAAVIGAMRMFHDEEKI